jgi:parallel beta-helix repeat protein
MKTRRQNQRSTVSIVLAVVALLGYASAAHATITLGNTGWSNPAVGTWDPDTKTGTLTQNVTDSIQIDSDGIILDGGGHTIAGGGNGVYLSGRTGVTVKNLTVTDCYYGIYLSLSSNNSLTGNTTSWNFIGIYLENSNNNTLKSNRATQNSYSGIYLDSSSYNTLTGNTASTNVVYGIVTYGSIYNTLTTNTASYNYYESGILLWYSSHETLENNTACDNISTNGIYLDSSSNNTVTGNTTNSNWICGIRTSNANDNALTANTASQNYYCGIWLESSNNDTLTNNTASQNSWCGIYILNSSSNTLTGNTASQANDGIFLYAGNNNTLTSNRVSENAYHGIDLYDSSGNQIYNNNFISNTTQAYVTGGSGNIFNLDKPTGGNYWSDWTTPDADQDGFVDNPYVFTGGQDNLPRTASGGPSIPNHPPTGIALSRWTVFEEQPVGTVVGVLSGTDPDPGQSETLVFSLVDGYGDNMFFSIDPVTKQLKTAAVFDYETKNFYDILVRATDTGVPPLTCDQAFPIRIDDVGLTLGDAGWSLPGVGTWDPVTRTGTLTRDVAEMIEITGNNIVLDGNGHSLIGSGKGDGVHLSYWTGVTVKNVTVQNFYYGIYLYATSKNTLIDNTALSNVGSGIMLASTSNNTLTGNTALNNNYGIWVYFAASINNTLTGNTASNNNYGIYVYHASGNNLTGNTTAQNNYGIRLEDSSNNQIYSNNFIRNATQAYVTGGSGNVFNLAKPIGGNYWSNWSVPDKDHDGFVDYPYGFTGGVDNLPIANHPPQVTVTGPSSGFVCPINTTIDFAGQLRDPDIGDTHTATWTISNENWTEDYEFEGTVSGTSVAGSVAFPDAGVYLIKLTVIDAAGASGEATAVTDAQGNEMPAFVVVYDPEGGFVTGGGWIWSPKGAYAADPALEGKATFGFNAKYQKGATVPTGQTEFVFQAGSLNFHATSYDWLVVAGSKSANFKGTGTINGSGSYKFKLWAGDDVKDTFHIRIWGEDQPGQESVVYDNRTDQVLGGGSIVIHTN